MPPAHTSSPAIMPHRRIGGTFLIKADPVFHDVVRPALHLVVNSTQIFTDDADSDELNTAEKEHQGDEGRETGLGDLEAEDTTEKKETAHCEAEACDERAGVGEQAKWQIGKAEQAVERVGYQFSKRHGRGAGGPLLPVVHDLRMGEADPASQAREKTVCLGELVEGRHRLLPKQTEGARIPLDRKVDEQAERFMEQIKPDASKTRFLPGAAHREHDLGAGTPCGHKLGNQFGWILEVGVHGDGRIGGADTGQTRGEGGLMTKVAGEIQQPETGICGDLGRDDFAGLVATAVVDEDGIPVHIGRRSEHGFQPPKQFGQDRGFIEDRDDDGDGWLGMQGDTLPKSCPSKAVVVQSYGGRLHGTLKTIGGLATRASPDLGLPSLALGPFGESLARAFLQMPPRTEWSRSFHRLPVEPLLLAVVLGAWWCVAVGSTLGKSATFDEPLHMVGGASYWLLNDYRLHPENGNLPQRWCTIPLVLAGWPLPSFEHPAWAVSNTTGLGRSYLFESGNPSGRMLLWARSFAAIWGVLVALLVFVWSRALFGPQGAWLSLAFCLADTTLLANAPLATSDTCAAFFFGGSTLAIWRMLQLPSPATVSVAALAVAGLFVAKLSAPLEIPVGIILLAIRCWFGPPWEVSWGGHKRSVSAGVGLATLGACVALAGIAAWLAVWIVFGFRYDAMNPQTAPAGVFAGWHTLADATAKLGGAKGGVLSFLGEHHMLPEAYLCGMAFVLNMLWRQSFFCGDYSIDGWSTYFPFTFLVKTPLPTLAGLFLLPVLAVRWVQKSSVVAGERAWYPLAPLFTLLAVYWAASVTTTLNIGHRHLLPIYPVIFVLLGSLPALTRARPGLRWLPWSLAACTSLVSFWAFPNYLAFFNGIVRQDEAWHYLVDSNLDWGQEQSTVASFMARERRTYGDQHPIYGCIFGPTPIQGLGAGPILLPTAFDDVPLPPLGPGTYCVSATHLQGIYVPMWGPWRESWEEKYQNRKRAVALLTPLSVEERQKAHGITEDVFVQIGKEFQLLEYHRFLAQLREREPDEVLNGAILIYRLDPATFDALLAAGPPAQAARFIE